MVEEARDEYGDNLYNILDYLNPFSENFFGYKLIELLGNLLKMLFVGKEVQYVLIVFH